MPMPDSRPDLYEARSPDNRVNQKRLLHIGYPVSPYDLARQLVYNLEIAVAHDLFEPYASSNIWAP